MCLASGPNQAVNMLQSGVGVKMQDFATVVATMNSGVNL
jgi:hypothetical protein